MRRILLAAAIVTAGMLAGWAPGGEPDQAGVGFVRVQVPAARIDEIPLDGERLVPMPLTDFERAVARITPPQFDLRVPRPVADAARYELSIDARGRLVGSVEFQLGATAAALADSVPLGAIDASNGRLTTAAGVGEGVIYGLPDGRVAMRAPAAGIYRCSLVCLPLGEVSGEYRLPLVSAAATSILLRLPADTRPLVTGMGSLAEVVTRAADGANTWQIDLVAADEVAIVIVASEARQPWIRGWNHVVLRGRQVEVIARLVPDSPWMAGDCALRVSAGLDISRARTVTGEPVAVRRPSGNGPRCFLDLPPSVVGTTMSIDVYGVAETSLAVAHPLPTVRPAADHWAGGGVTLYVDPVFAVQVATLEECLAVTPEVAARWPMPSFVESLAASSAVLHLEQQSAAALATVTIDRRIARLESTRVTTVEISPGAVLGRAACDVRVASGEAFAISAQVAQEWFIDSVEAVEWQPAGSADRPDDGTGDGPMQPLVDAGRTVEWRVVRSGGGGELRIELAEAATPSRSLGLRITGHRRGVPLGGEFATADMDMVRLEGESADSALVDYRVGPEAVVEISGQAIGILPAEARFAPLQEAGSPRGRLLGGDRVTDRQARLVRRRPPLNAEPLVQLVARDGRLTESFSFTCRPDAGSIDSIVVHFSEPLGDAVEWSLIEPASGTLFARRLERSETERGDEARLAVVQDSWLIEFRPAVESAVTFRASRMIPFASPVPAPLAWVEGADAAHGTLLIRSGGGGSRPGVVSHRLTERPPADEQSASAVVTELSYGPPETVLGGPDDPPAAQLVPPDAAEARAWAWREITTAWCHESGLIECETSFDIENRGRDEVALAVPLGLRLEEVFIDGEPAPFDGAPEAGGTTRVTLPAGRGRLLLHVRGTASRDRVFGAWRLDAVACTIDAPVLDRVLRLMMPPELAVIAPGGPSRDAKGWVERLFEATVVGAAAPGDSPLVAGFRMVDLAPVGPGGAAGVVIVRRRLVATVAIVAALAAAATLWSLIRRSPPLALTLLTGLAMAALWLEPPFATVARAAWWGGLAVALCGVLGRRLWRPAAPVASLVACLLASSLTAARGEDLTPFAPYRVLITTGSGGGTALVPEPLFRLLATADEAAVESVRVRGCHLVVGGADDGAWRIELDLDADQGGVLVLHQGDDGGHWRPHAGGAAGVTVDVSPDGRTARVAVTVPGSHRIAIDMLPHWSREGIVETTVVRLPPAARSRVGFEDAPTAGGRGPDVNAVRWQCDRGAGERGWLGVAADAGVFDVSRATRVRLARSIDPRHPLAAVPEEAVSVNQVVWGEDGCTVKAAFEIRGGRNVVRSVVVRTHGPLEPVTTAGGSLTPRPVGSGRYLVDLPEPTAGACRLELTFSMPLASPVGVFEVPGVWLEGAGSDLRTVRCLAAADLDLIPELPAGFSLVRPRDEDGLGVVAVWRSEKLSSAVGPRVAGSRARADPPAISAARARMAVRRRPQPDRLTQRVQVEFAPDHIGLSLECQIDAASSPFTELPIEVPASATIDRLVVVEETAALPVPVDVCVSRPTATRLSTVVQRPRSGRFRVTLTARIEGRPLVAGDMPLARAVVSEGPPLLVSWRESAGQDLRVSAFAASPTGEAGVEATAACEVAPGEPGPTYVLSERQESEAVADRPVVGPAAAMPAALGNAVEATSVHVVLDGRSRVWGMARFDLATAEPTVRLRMPAGLRLFDVLVDGRETQAVPVGAGGWDVRLQDIQWPRSILVVFSGEAGGRPTSGDAIRIEPPRIEGLPSQDVLWTIDAPGGMQLRVAEPARVIDAAAWQTMQAAGRQRIAALFDVAISHAAEPDRERLVRFAMTRQAGGRPAVESAWERAVQTQPTAGRTRVHLVANEPAGVTVRAVRRRTDAVASRGLASVALMAALVIGWSVSGRWLAARSVAITWAWPWLVAAIGGVWVMLLRPALPGWALLAAGLIAALARFCSREPR